MKGKREWLAPDPEDPTRNKGEASFFAVLSAPFYVAPNAYTKDAPPIALQKVNNPIHQNYWNNDSQPVHVPWNSDSSPTVGLHVQLGTTIFFMGQTPRYLGIGLFCSKKGGTLKESLSTARYPYPILLEPLRPIKVPQGEEYSFFDVAPPSTPIIPTSISTEPRVVLTDLRQTVTSTVIEAPVSAMTHEHFHLLAPNHSRVTKAVGALVADAGNQARVLVFCPFDDTLLTSPLPFLRPGQQLDAYIGSQPTLTSHFPNLFRHGYRRTSVCMAIGARDPMGRFSYLHELASRSGHLGSLELVLLTTNKGNLQLAMESAEAWEALTPPVAPSKSPSDDLWM